MLNFGASIRKEWGQHRQPRSEEVMKMMASASFDQREDVRLWPKKSGQGGISQDQCRSTASASFDKRASNL